MRERAQIAGGGLDVESAPGEGCVMSAWVPLEAPAAPMPVVEPQEAVPPPEPLPVEPATPAAPDASLPRSVPGFTWQ
jgi:hypothetical protein